MTHSHLQVFADRRSGDDEKVASSLGQVQRDRAVALERSNETSVVLRLVQVPLGVERIPCQCSSGWQ